MSDVSLGLVVGLMVVFTLLAVAVASRLSPPPISLKVAGGCSRQLRGINLDRVLFAYRAIVCIYAFCVLASQLSTHGDRNLCFFTVWSWTLLCIYFGVAAVASSAHLSSRAPDVGRSAVPVEGASVGSAPAVGARYALARLCQLLLSTLAASALMLDVVLWGVLYPADSTPGHGAYLKFYSYNMHALNLVLVFTELLLNRIPLRLKDLLVAVTWPLLYSEFTILRVALDPGTRQCLTTHSDVCTTRADPSKASIVWPYFFMDTSKTTAVFWYLGLALLYVVAYLGVLGILTCLGRQEANRRALVSSGEAAEGDGSQRLRELA